MKGFTYEPINGFARHKEVELKPREWRELLRKGIAAGGRRIVADGDTMLSMPGTGLVFEVYGTVSA